MALLQDLSTGALDQDDIARQIESMQKQLNEWARRISNEDRTKIIKDDAGTERLLTGYKQGGFSNGNVGVKLSQEGKSVLSASNNELIFSTDFNNFKIVDSGEVTISPFNVAANSSNIGQASVFYNSDSLDSPIVLGFTNSLPSGGLYLWQGISPESTLSSPASSPMGFTVYVHFATIVSPGTIIGDETKVEINFNVNVRNATGSALNNITYDIKYFVLVETAPS